MFEYTEWGKTWAAWYVSIIRNIKYEQMFPAFCFADFNFDKWTAHIIHLVNNTFLWFLYTFRVLRFIYTTRDLISLPSQIKASLWAILKL